MDEQVIQDLYNRAVSLGYKKSREEFVSLLQSDSSVQNDNYSYVQSKGYQKSMNDFLGLVGGGSGEGLGVFEQVNQITSNLQASTDQQQPAEDVKKKDNASFVEKIQDVASGTTDLPSVASSLDWSPSFLETVEQKPWEKNFVRRLYGSDYEGRFAKNITTPLVTEDEDGFNVDYSTHKMASAEVDGKYIAYPTVVQKKGEGNLTQLSDAEALEYALQNNEYLSFSSDAKAKAYAEGGYKRGTMLEDYSRPDWFNKSINSIDKDLINQTEEFVIPKLNYQFGPLDFSFKVSGWSGDYMVATAPNGDTKEFSLDPYLDVSAQGTAEELKNWIKEHSPISGLETLNSEYENENKRYANQKEIEEDFKKVSNESTLFKTDVNTFLAEKNAVDQELNALTSAKSTAPLLPEAQARYDILLGQKEKLKVKYQELADRENLILSQAAVIDKAVGKYQMMEKEQGDYAAGSWNAALEGEGSIGAGTVNLLIDIMQSKYFNGIDVDQMSQQVPEGTATGDLMQDASSGGLAVNNARRLNEALGAPTDQKELDAIMSTFRREGDSIYTVGKEGEGLTTMTADEKKKLKIFQEYIPMPKAGQSYKDWYNSLTDDQRTALVDKSNDDVKKDLKGNLLPAMREGLRTVMGDDAATVAWSRTKEETFWGGALLGTAKSLPSIIGGAGPVGWAQRTAQAYAQGSDAVYEEMSKNPAFDNISESEKLSVVAPIGIAVGALESLGFSNLINNKGLVNRLVVRAMGKTVGSVGAKTFGQLVKDDIQSMGAKGLLTLAGAGLAEAETGTTQQIAEYAIKDIYNMAKEKDMFQTPDFLTADYFKDIATAGAQEMIGGFVMGVPNAVGAAFTKTGYKSLSDNEFKVFESIANDEKMQSAYILSLKNKVAAGQMKLKDAKESLNNYRNSVGLYRSLPANLSTEAKKEAMNLLKERRDLEQYMSGKDDAMVKKQKSRVEVINGKLDELATKSEAEAQAKANAEKILGLTEEEQNRKTELEETLASREEDEKNGITSFEVTDGEGGIKTVTYEEAQAELDALNEKENADVVEETTPTEQQVPTVLSTPEETTAALELLPEGERTNITFTQEDGTETPVMGNEKVLAELFHQAQAVPEADRTDFHQNIIDAVNVALADQIDEQMQEQMQEQEDNPFGNLAEDDEQIVFEAENLEDIPEQFRDGATVSGPMEITARKKILGLPVGKKEVVKRKGKTFKFIVTGAEAKANVDSLLPLFDNGKIRYDGTLARRAKATDKATLFKNVSKSLASVLPNLGIRNFKNNEEMKTYVDSKYKGSPVSKQVLGSEGGLIIYDKDGKPAEILINETTSGATTLPHEVWHALLVKAFGENEALFKEFRDSIIQTLTNNGYQDIVDTLNTFSSSPEYKASNKQAQEWLVEFGGLLTASGITPENLNPQSKKLLEQIKAIFNKIAMELFDTTLFLEDAVTEDVLDFIVSISDSMSRGEDISKFFDLKRPDAKTSKTAATVSKQMGKGSPIEEVRRIAQRYNINNSGFAPSQINEFALDRELRPYGYSAKRAAPDANGKQRGVYILNPKGRFYNPFKGKFQKVSSQTTQPKATKSARAKQIYNAETLINKLSQITGIPVKVINDPSQMFKGKIEDRVATINMAYVTADTPIHEILGHPVIASLKETDRAFYDKLVNEVKNSKQGAEILARIKEDYSEYSEEQQMEEAIVEMLSLMVSNRLENNSTLKRMLSKLLQDIINFINKNFKTKFRESDVINMSSLSKDIENYINQTESAFNKSIDDLVNLFLGGNTSTYLSLVPNEITQNGRTILEKKYGETIGRSVAGSIQNAPLHADLFVKFVDNMLVDPSQAKDFLSSETNLSYVNYFFDQHLYPNQNTKKIAKVTTDPFELISPTGYQLHPVTELQHFETFRKDYDKGYTICTFATALEPGRRLAHSFIFWIRKPYASEILPQNMLTQEYLQSDSADAAEWRKYLKSKGLEKKDGTYEIPLRPSIYDPYAVSSISLQISRDPRSSFQKMVNRYNHHIDISKGGDGVADAAFKNKLDNIVKGLDDSIRNYVNLPAKVKSKYDYDTDNVIPVGDKLYVYENEVNNFFLSAQGFVKNNLYTKLIPDVEVLADEFLFNKKTNTIISFGNSADFFEGADDVSFEKDKIIVKSSKYNYTTEIFLNKKKQIVGISSDTTRDIDDKFFASNNTIESIDLPNVKNIGSDFLNQNRVLKSINLPQVNKIGSGFLTYNQEVTSLDFPKLITVYDGFLSYNLKISSIDLPNLTYVKNMFIAAANIKSANLPELRRVGDSFLMQSRDIASISLPMLEEAGNAFLSNAVDLNYISLPNLKELGYNFLYHNDALESIDLPVMKNIGAGFLFKNNSLKNINLPNVTDIGDNFLMNNDKLVAIDLPNVIRIRTMFMYTNRSLRAINMPEVARIGGSFLFYNETLQFISIPKVNAISEEFLRSNYNLQKINVNNDADVSEGFFRENGYVDKYMKDNKPQEADADSKLFAELNNKLGFERFSDLYSEFLKSNKNGSMSQFAESVGESSGPTVSAQSGSTLQESLKTIPGYDDMIRKSKNIALRTSRRYGADWDRIMNAVMEFVMNSPVYTLADDSQREQMVRDVRADFGKKEKAAPSPKKVFELKSFTDLFGKIDVKMITMSDYDFLKEQMKLIARTAKDTKTSWMAASKLVAKQIKELVIAGKISNRQAASVISRLATVNMFNQDSIDKFTEYMVKVFTDANYDMKIEKARKKLPRALSNVKKKIGIANAIAPDLVQLFSINPNLIPDSVLETYLELVEMFGSSDSVLNLDDIDLVAVDVKSILDAVEGEVSSAEDLALRFEEFDDKVYDTDGKLEYAKTVAKMLDTGAIDDAEAEIMRKYKKIILPKVAPDKKTDAEIEAEKKVLIKAIKAVTVNTSRLPTRLERDLAKRLVALLKPELLKNLSVNQLENVVKLIDNINAGYLPRYAQITVEKLNSLQSAANDLETAIEDAKALKGSSLVGKLKAAFTGRTSELEMIRRTPLIFIDHIFGDFKSSRIFNAVFSMMAQGQAAFDTDINKINKKLDDARMAVSKSHSYNANSTLESSFRMMAYMIQLEYESNLGSDQVNPASSFIKATIKRMLNDKNNKFKERDAKLLEDILEKYGVNVGVDAKGKPIREIDNKKLFKSFNIAERNAIKTIREINDGLTEKAQYTASIIRGESITPLNNYVHLPVLHDYDPNERSTGIQNSNAYSNSRKPSTKAKTLEGRTGDVSPINFDAFASAQKGAKATLLDFHLTEAIRTSRKTINETRRMMEEKGTLRGKKRDLINAIESANEEVIRNVLTNNFITDSFADTVVNEVSKQGYRAILASSKRFTSELASNVGFALFTDPMAFAQGVKYKKIVMSPKAIEIMMNVASKQTSRLFSGNSLNGKFIDTSIFGQASGVRTNKVQGSAQNVTNQVYNYSLKYIKNGVEFVADGLISTPDKLVMRPIWFGAFANEFKSQTGTEIDFDKIAANDEAYMAKYGEAISNARDAADNKSTLTGATDNPFMGILKGAVTADQSGWTRGYNNFNNFMTRFAIYEFAAARQGIYAAMGDGTLTRKQGAALLAGVITRMTVYTLLTNILGSLLISALGDDEEEKETEKSFMQKFGQALASTATSLLVGRDFGNFVKVFSNAGVEKINEEYFDFLRNGDYDPYDDDISYSAMPKERKGHQIDLGDYITMFTGSFTPLAKTVDLAIRKAHEDPKKEGPAIERQKAEIYKRLPLEILGNMGLIPLYKEAKDVLMSQIYSSLEQEIKAEKISAKEREIEKEKLGKYETRTDMKRYDPELYEKTFGPGSPGYDAEKAKKKLAEEKNEAKRAEKDKYFGYQESYTDRIDREDRERIEKIKESPNYDPNAVPTKDLLTRSELKEYFPEEYEKRYGEDSEYYKEKEPENKEEKLARAKRKAMLDAAYGRPKAKKGEGKLGGSRLGEGRLGGARLGGSRLGGGRLGGSRL